MSVSNAGEPDFGSGELLTALQAEPAKRTVAMKEIVSKAYSLNDPELRRLQTETDAAKKRINDLRKAFPKVMVMRDGTKRETRVLIRGVYNKPTDIVVGSNTPESLPPLPEDAPRNRLGLAEWLVNSKHPLTARVTVNRIWQQFFGTGLVKTTEDFGVQSERPSHPGLLDWLAQEFVSDNWNVKGCIGGSC